MVSTNNEFNPREQQVVALFRSNNSKVSLETDGKVLLVAHHPTLNEELHTSPWMLRAWTYQEALLSRRRIIIARHQVFFSCNQMDRSEDGFDLSRYEISNSLNQMVNPLHCVDMSSKYLRFGTYTKLVANYSKRQLTNDGDGLNAISAILSTWERELPCEKFIFALPSWAFREALLWYHPRQSTEDCERRRTNLDNLPSWSWCGWQLNHCVYFLHFKGVCWEQQITGSISPPLFVSYNHEVLVSNCGDEKDKKVWGLDLIDPAIFQSPIGKEFAKVAEEDKKLGESSNQHHDDPEPCKLLLIRGIILRVPFEISRSGLVVRGLYGEVYLDVEEHDFMGDSGIACHDCLLISTLMLSAPEINCIVLLWQDSTRNITTRTAKRAGVIMLRWHEESDFFEEWPDLKPKWDRFYLS